MSDEKPDHVDLSARARPTVLDSASKAAKAVFDAGGSPRAQIDAARKVSPRPINYLPHQGAQERAKRRRQAEHKAEKALAKLGRDCIKSKVVQVGDHPSQTGTLIWYDEAAGIDLDALRAANSKSLSEPITFSGFTLGADMVVDAEGTTITLPMMENAKSGMEELESGRLVIGDAKVSSGSFWDVFNEGWMEALK